MLRHQVAVQRPPTPGQPRPGSTARGSARWAGGWPSYCARVGLVSPRALLRWHAQLSVEGSAGRCDAAGPDAIRDRRVVV